MTDNTDPFAGYTAAQLRDAADAKDRADAEALEPWRRLIARAIHSDTRVVCAKTIRDGAAKLLGVTL